MHLLYLDDSGSVNNKREDYFVLGGVSVPEHKVRYLSYQLNELARKVDGDNHLQVEFHAADMFAGRGVWARYPKREERIHLIKEVLTALKSVDGATVFACAVHKASFPGKDPVVMAFEDLSSRFDKYVQRQTSRSFGLVVLDKASYENNLQTLASQIRQEGNRWGQYLKSIAEVPLFVDSKASRITQLADHIAYAVFRRYNASDLNYFNCFESRFDRNENTVFGLVHLQTYNRSCTCPACVTRKR